MVLHVEDRLRREGGGEGGRGALPGLREPGDVVGTGVHACDMWRAGKTGWSTAEAGAPFDTAPSWIDMATMQKTLLIMMMRGGGREIGRGIFVLQKLDAN